MKAAVRSHPELRILGDPTFVFSFTSDEFDIYHVNDFMRTKGWRFNGQQYPNAIHMAVTRPHTQPGLADAFAADLDDAIAYAREHKDEKPMSAAIYGGVEGGMTDEADEFIRSVMAKERIEIVMTDVNMPGLGGFELAEIAKRLRPGLQVIFLSGREADGHGLPLIQ